MGDDVIPKTLRQAIRLLWVFAGVDAAMSMANIAAGWSSGALMAKFGFGDGDLGPATGSSLQQTLISVLLVGTIILVGVMWGARAFLINKVIAARNWARVLLMADCLVNAGGLMVAIFLAEKPPFGFASWAVSSIVYAIGIALLWSGDCSVWFETGSDRGVVSYQNDHSADIREV